MSHFDGRTQLGDALGRALEGAAGEVEAISREIFANPEPAFGEQRAVQLQIDYLTQLGYQVESDVAGLPTAFIARMQNFDHEAMRKGLRHGHVGVISEYDAGPEGHVHGRHLVAGAALAAAVGLAEALKGIHGEVSIIGCPAAGTGEGKRLLLDEGVFEALDLVLGAVPASSGSGFQPTINGTGGTLAVAHIVVTFAGDAGQSDARQRLATAIDGQLHELSQTDSLDVSLSETAVEFDLSSATNPDLNALIERIDALAQDAARETGSTVTVDVVSRTPAMNVNRILARRAKTFADRMGLKQDRIFKHAPRPASDWGHASLVSATVPVQYIVSQEPVEAGTPAFAEACTTAFAYEQMISAALTVGLTGLDTLGDMEFRGFAEGELIRTLKAQGVQRIPRRWLGVRPLQSHGAPNGKQPPALGPLSQPRRG